MNHIAINLLRFFNLLFTNLFSSKYLLTYLLSPAELYEYALLPEHLTSVDPSIYATTITDTGALSVSSGSKTGRTPKEKRVVLDETTKDVS